MKRKGYTDIHALVAFSGKVKLEDKEYTEPGMNGFTEKKLPAEFNSDNYNVLIVADKYQTGFDQKKLCAMYILKKLHDVSTIQTLSRLNRICPPYNKHTFILDFVNNYDDIIKDFSKFYTVTELSNSITPSAMYDIEAKLDGYYVIDPDDVDKFNDLLYSGDISAKAKKNMTYLLQKTKKAIESHPTEERNEIILTVKHFVRFYEFLIQASCFEDKELHKKYNFLNYLKSYLKMGGSGGGFNLAGKIKASGFVQKKKEEQDEQMKAAAQTVTMLIIDKKRMKMKDAGLPSQVMEQANKLMQRAKLPIVKAKVGPRVMTLIADEQIYDDIPVKKEVKATVSGLYITGVRGLRGPLEKPVRKKKGFRAKLQEKYNEANARLKESKSGSSSKKK